jgi:hypothetical protein
MGRESFRGRLNRSLDLGNISSFPKSIQHRHPAGKKSVPESAPKVDAIILSGTHLDRRRLIRNLNKAFLPMGEATSLDLVLEAVSRAKRVERLFVVGPEEELDRRVPPGKWGYRLVPQAGRMLDNAWRAYRVAEESLSGGSRAERERRPYLILTADIPLAVPEAIDDFVERCFALEAERGETVDFFPGLADEVALAPFYPRPPRSGIRRPYMELHRQRLRLANIYLARPGRIRNLEVLQQGFSARKLTQWKSVARLISAFLKNPGGIRGAFHVACFQAASLLERSRMTRLSPLVRGALRLAVIERSASMMLGCCFAAVVTPYGGLSLDIDDEADYGIILENLDAWREHQRSLLAESLSPADPTLPNEAAVGQVAGSPATSPPASSDILPS